MRALVVGGTGPTGPFIVNGLLERGYQVTIFHRGTHENPEIEHRVSHIHGDPHFRETIDDALVGRTYDLVVATYGRLRHLAAALQGRTPRFIGVGGVAIYRGFKEPERLRPPGLPVPTPETWPLVTGDDELRFSQLMTQTEQAVFIAHPTATMFRYPYVYGPHQLIPREWCFIRRIRDKRPFIIVPDGGLLLAAHGYAGNLAHAVLLAVDKPRESAGKAYNCGDERTLTLRQTIEMVADTMGERIELASLPNEAAKPSLPYTLHDHPHHWVMDISRIKDELGYRDPLPVEQALPETVRWYLENPPEAGGEIEQRLADPFDYELEDRLVEIQRRAHKELEALVGQEGFARPHAYPHPKAPGERDHRAR
ncbi:hypothetical protein [Reyranella sp.]|uniref:hypothetical protein n=1 Tax=Reyranella sp. TaxID=1929291 RepID=UPI0012269A00|nr:hypothetical protein [Reyranella sp.]TAJ82096.1 MAG: epimerase [Reyranella sp.]